MSDKQLKLIKRFSKLKICQGRFEGIVRGHDVYSSDYFNAADVQKLIVESKALLKEIKIQKSSVPDECAANGSTGHHFTVIPQPDGTQATACEWCGECEEDIPDRIGNELHNLANWLQNQSHIDPPEIEEFAGKLGALAIRLWKVKS